MRAVEELETFSATILAGIDQGGLYPDTIDDRSIMIMLQRRNTRLKKEKKESFRVRSYKKDGLALKAKIEACAKPRLTLAGTLVPEMPEGIEDRFADAWEQLFIPARLVDIAEVTDVTDVTGVTLFRGVGWEAMARDAALADLYNDDSINYDEGGPALLRSIATIVMEDPLQKYDFIYSTKVPGDYLLDKLHNMPEAPWGMMSETRRPLTDRQMSNMLKVHGVHRPNKQGTIRIGNDTVKGYDLRMFYDAIERYCPDIKLPEIPKLRDGNTVSPPSVTSVTSVTTVTNNNNNNILF